MKLEKVAQLFTPKQDQRNHENECVTKYFSYISRMKSL